MRDRENGGSRGTVGRPDGLPLGRAFSIAPGMANEPFREAGDDVARVHGDGDLPAIPMVWDSSLTVRARFMMRAGEPSAILARPRTVGLEIALIHEVGHVLDYCAIDRYGEFASASSPRMAPWLAAVLRSPTFRRLSTASEQAIATLRPTDHEYRRRIGVLRLADELWARSYTQYVVRRSGRLDLVARLQGDYVSVAGFNLPLHWEEREFDPIDDQIEHIVRRLGWRRS